MVLSEDLPVTDYEVFVGNVISGGVPKEGISLIEEPVYISVAKADQQIADRDYVLLLFMVHKDLSWRIIDVK